MSDVYQPPKDLSDAAHCSSMADYRRMHDESIEDPYAFWSPIVQVLKMDFEHRLRSNVSQETT
jgi:hypothetical protein